MAAPRYTTWIRSECSDWAVAIAVDPASSKHVAWIVLLPASPVRTWANREWDAIRRHRSARGERSGGSRSRRPMLSKIAASIWNPTALFRTGGQRSMRSPRSAGSMPAGPARQQGRDCWRATLHRGLQGCRGTDTAKKPPEACARHHPPAQLVPGPVAWRAGRHRLRHPLCDPAADRTRA